MDERLHPVQNAVNHNGFLKIVDVLKAFGNVVAVRSLNLSIKRKEIFALLGSSGCGKSTLLRLIAGLEEVTSGQIVLDGRDITNLPAYLRPVNMMFQSYALFPHMTVEKNVAFGLRQEGIPRSEIHDRVFGVLSLVQMTDYSQCKPSSLSGGQQQRVALARSLVKQPKLLLLDEPMSALDKKIRQRTQIELTKILEKVGVTCIIVTHDQDEAMTMAHRLAVMTEGKIVQCGSPKEVYAFPSSRFVASFIGSTNLFFGNIISEISDYLTIESEDLVHPIRTENRGKRALVKSLYVSIRPERLMVLRAQPNDNYNWAHGVVIYTAWMGSYALYQIRLESGKVVEASVPCMIFAEIGSPGIDEEVFVSWDTNSTVLLTS